jgi:molybdopterin-containing oxidoreductase family iron-sulfur binding subunit
MNRRTFLKMAGMGSISFAFGCNPPPKKILSQVQAPDDMVTGRAAWYASTCRECPAGCGILAKSREARLVKIEGNPLHPINKGKLCMRGQAALQGIYNPDRLKTAMLKENGQWQSLSFSKAESILKTKAAQAAQKGENRRQRTPEHRPGPCDRIPVRQHRTPSHWRFLMIHKHRIRTPMAAGSLGFAMLP